MQLYISKIRLLCKRTNIINNILIQIRATSIQSLKYMKEQLEEIQVQANKQFHQNNVNSNQEQLKIIIQDR